MPTTMLKRVLAEKQKKTERAKPVMAGPKSAKWWTSLGSPTMTYTCTNHMRGAQQPILLPRCEDLSFWMLSL
eukprot:CAMPEP_0185906782 /NCGR_PEP_ID=MMETSP0196C-20130402/5930_1 /TAXON_ID=2932 /ORGANISM="Alexandrium fundyense, Strain CCMP1719" /LENGTH=71 /DNA_ID=CAMNT_0028626605 /DNA_START=73 /DNA_END=285 /DNA_ORIENTATION=-